VDVNSVLLIIEIPVLIPQNKSEQINQKKKLKIKLKNIENQKCNK